MSQNIIILANNSRYKFIFDKLSKMHNQENISYFESIDHQALSRIDPKYIFIPHWSEILPKELYAKYNCIMFHMTDLPYGRGGSPLQNLIIQGKKDTVISAFKCTGGLDEGPIYLKKPLGLQGTAAEIFKRSMDIIVNMIQEICRNNYEPTPQIGDVFHFKRRVDRDGDIGRLESLEKIYDYIRMLDCEGYPRAHLRAGKIKLEFEGANLDLDGLTAKVRIKVE